MGAAEELCIPDLGDAEEVAVIEVRVVDGDRVSAGDTLLVVETDKATMDIPAELAGTVQSIDLKVGDRVRRGVRIATLVTDAAEEDSKATVPQAAVQAEAALAQEDKGEDRAALTAAADTRVGHSPSGGAETSGPAGSPPYAGPGARKLARELGMQLTTVRGSGPHGRITADDLYAAVRQRLPSVPEPMVSGHVRALDLPAQPEVDFSRFGPVERRPLSRIRRISGAALHRNWVSIPHVTNHDEVDVTELEAFRQQVNREHAAEGPRLSLLAFAIKASVAALKRYPAFNASLVGEGEVVLKRYFHIGFAADTAEGLLVPVIRNADAKGLLQIAREAAALAALARDGSLSMEQMRGGCFSISSLGGIGGTHFTPIINAPEVAILGIGRIQQRLRQVGDQTQTRWMLPLSLSWDHRAVDGAAAARFLTELGRVLQDARRLLL